MTNKFYKIYGGGNGKQWDELIHNGPMFAPLYEPHHIPIIVKGIKHHLTELAEEYITMYARYLGTEYTNNPRISNRFNRNFLHDLKKVLPKNINISNMSEIDMNDIKKHLDKIKEKKAIMSKEEKDKIKNKNEELEEPYKYCMVNGGRMKVGNYKIEPPGIFLGRGDHPKLGCIKKRINPEDVIINLSKTAPIPKPNMSNPNGTYNWGKVINNNEVVWLATWNDNISGKNKYVFTSMESIFKSKSDMDKFDLARKLKKKINQIRSSYYEDMKGIDEIKKQLSTALYLIDNLALRVGGTKDTKEQADTVGVTSLRVEHIIINDATHNDNIIKLDFLGKDSVRYCRKVKVDEIVYNNIKSFINNKNKKADLFDKISSSSLNNYLNNMMEGLTAKVWRTYNASMLFQKELDRVNPNILEKMPESEKINYLMSIFNQANTAVALLCNHQKNVSTDIEKSVKQIDDKIKKYKKRKQKTKDKEKIKLIEAKIITLKMRKETKVKMKNVSLGTSKNNYIDPRIIFSFIAKYNIPEDKLFNKALITRFDWAKKEGSDYRF